MLYFCVFQFCYQYYILSYFYSVQKYLIYTFTHFIHNAHPNNYVIALTGMNTVALYGMVWYGMVWYGMVWYGMVWYGMVWYGMVWLVWYGMVWYGMVWYGMVWYGMVWYGMVVNSACVNNMGSLENSAFRIAKILLWYR